MRGITAGQKWTALNSTKAGWPLTTGQTRHYFSPTYSTHHHYLSFQCFEQNDHIENHIHSVKLKKSNHDLLLLSTKYWSLISHKQKFMY